MKLSAEITELFYKVQSALLVYVNRKLKLTPAAQSLEEIRNLDLDEKIMIRNAMWKNDTLLDSSVEANPSELDGRELELVGQRRRYRIEGRFLVVAYLKSHTVSFEQVGQIPYGVLALQDDLQIILGSRLPIMVDGVLLPFKDKITYDGLISSYRVTSGSGARRSINDVFQQAKAKRGIVTRLPCLPESGETPSDLELLKFYLRNERNRQQYREEIWDLTHNNPQMLTAYHQIMGKNHARHYGKE